MSNKKLNIKSERLSRSLYISDEFYKPGVDKVIGKVYRNSRINTYRAPMEGEYPKYILHNASTQAWNLQNWCKLPSQFRTYTDPYRPGENPYSLTPFCWIPDEGSDIDKNLGTDAATISTMSYIRNILQSCESGVVMAYATPSLSDYDNAYCCVDCTYVFKLMTAEEFYHYIEEISSPEYDALRAELKNSDGSFCQNDYFAVSLDSEYSHLIYDSPAQMANSQGEEIIYSSRDFWPQSACYQSYWWPLDEYNGLPNLNKIDMNATDFTIIDDNYETTFGWYWDGLRWQPFSSEEALKAEEVEEIVNNMALTNVTTGAFRLPTIDYGELLAEYDVSTSSYYHTASCPWIRIMKIPNFHKDLVYNVIVPSTYDYLTDISDANRFGTLYLSWNYRLIPGGNSIQIYRESTSIDQFAYLKVDTDGYLWLSMKLELDKDGYTAASYTAAQIANECVVTTWLNSLYIIPSIKTDGYECNWKNYLSSCTVNYASVDWLQDDANEEEWRAARLFSSQALNNTQCGYGDYRYNFIMRFTPKVSGTYLVLFAIRPYDSYSSLTVRANAGISSSATDVSAYNGRSLSLGGSTEPFFAGFKITADADVPQYIHINSAGGYFTLMYIEIHGLPQLNTSDEGAQIPDSSSFIQNVLYTARGTSASTALSNNRESDSYYGAGMTPEIWEVDTTV